MFDKKKKKIPAKFIKHKKENKENLLNKKKKLKFIEQKRWKKNESLTKKLVI